MYKYIIGIGIKGFECDNPGERYIDMFREIPPEELNDDKIATIRKCNRMNFLPNPPTYEETLEMAELKDLDSVISSMAMRSIYHPEVIICLFSTENKYTIDQWVDVINAMSMEKIKAAEIGNLRCFIT